MRELIELRISEGQFHGANLKKKTTTRTTKKNKTKSNSPVLTENRFEDSFRKGRVVLSTKLDDLI